MITPFLNFKPSTVDIANYTKRMETLKEDFMSSKNDSLFVANYAETPMMDSISLWTKTKW